MWWRQSLHPGSRLGQVVRNIDTTVTRELLWHRINNKSFKYKCFTLMRSKQADLGRILILQQKLMGDD